MEHLNTRQCECGCEITAHHMTSRLEPTAPRGLYGGNVQAFADGKCPECGNRYRLWLRQARNSWEVVTLADMPGKFDQGNSEELLQDNEVPDFESMDRDELKAWLDENEVEYTANWGDTRLRETAQAAQEAK